MHEKIPAPSWQKQIRNLLVVLFSGVLAALALGSYFLYYYGPSGVYVAQNVLLTSTTMEKIQITDISFSHFDPQTSLLRKESISLDAYKEFYDQVAHDRSIPAEQGTRHFLSKISALKLYVAPNQKLYQEIDFSPDGDYYRVQLFEHNGLEPFAYFYHPGILLKAQKQFIPQPGV